MIPAIDTFDFVSLLIFLQFLLGILFTLPIYSVSILSHLSLPFLRAIWSWLISPLSLGVFTSPPGEEANYIHPFILSFPPREFLKWFSPSLCWLSLYLLGWLVKFTMLTIRFFTMPFGYKVLAYHCWLYRFIIYHASSICFHFPSLPLFFRRLLDFLFILAMRALV